MKFQAYKSSCGPAALCNALAALGIERTEDELTLLCKTRAETGTSLRQLLAAIKAVSTPDQRLLGEPMRWRTSDQAQVGLWYYIAERGRPVILCVDRFEHWVVATGHLGTRFAIIDSSDNRMVIYYTLGELAERWEGPNGWYHGVIV